MNKFPKLSAIIISVLIILITIFFLLLKLIQITPNEKELVISSPNVKNKVEINYNKVGFPNIKANNLNDLYFGIGYAQAENRIWQMDLLRRMSQGKLSEILGEKFITYDKFIRFFNQKNLAKQTYSKIPNDLKSILRSYSSGVNTFIKENSENLAIEFSIFNYIPEKWEPDDCILIFNFLDFLYNSSFKDNLWNLILKESISEEEYSDFFEVRKPVNLLDTNIKASNLNSQSIKKNILTGILDSVSQFAFLFNPSHGNSFAIRKQKGEYFQSIIASDFATELSIPSFGMIMIATSPEIRIIGNYIPGIPFCLAGKNNLLSWVLNISNSNRWFFEEIILNNDKSKYKDSDSLWKKVIYITDTILVKNSYKRLYYLKFINNNGIFTESFTDSGLNLIAYSPADSIENKAFINLYKLNFTQNINEIQDIKKNWSLPEANLIFGDQVGNIGIVALGNSFSNNTKKEIKSSGNLNHIVNPKTNFIISTNVTFDTNYKINFVTNYRSKRLEKFLSSLPDFELRDIKNIQLDAKSEFAKELLNIIIPIIQDKTYLLNNDEKEIFEILKKWDFSYTRNQKQPIILEELIRTILFKTFYDNVDSIQISYFLNKFDFYERFIKIMQNKFARFFDDLNTAQIENRDYIIFTSAKSTFQRLSKYLRSTQKNKYFNWGSYNLCGFSHFAHNNKLINATFSFDSIEINGHRTCISSAWKNDLTKKSFGTIGRIIFDNNSSGIFTINSLGNSGDPTNDHFSDQLQVWKNGGYLKIFFDAKFEKITNKRVFQPQN